jgi:hypothetical protein
MLCPTCHVLFAPEKYWSPCAAVHHAWVHLVSIRAFFTNIRVKAHTTNIYFYLDRSIKLISGIKNKNTNFHRFWLKLRPTDDIFSEKSPGIRKTLSRTLGAGVGPVPACAFLPFVSHIPIGIRCKRGVQRVGQFGSKQQAIWYEQSLHVSKHFFDECVQLGV